jgi:hypothetical protein
MNVNDPFSLGNTHPSGNTDVASTAINQIISGILTSVNGAVNTESGYYESEFAFNADDLLSAYTQLIGSQPPVNPPNNPSNQ